MHCQPIHAALMMVVMMITTAASPTLHAGAGTMVNTACSGSGAGDVATRSAVEAACQVTVPAGCERQDDVSGTVA